MMQSTYSLAFLPIANEYWMCRSRGAQVEPLTKATGQPDARFVIAPDGASFAVLDSDSKRAGLFRVLAEEPWFERVLSFSTLPKRCAVDDIVLPKWVLEDGRTRDEVACWSAHSGAFTRKANRVGSSRERLPTTTPRPLRRRGKRRT